MKNYNLILALFVLCLGFTACDDEEYQSISYNEINLETADPFINIVTPVISFVAGTPDYAVQIVGVPGKSAMSKINLYKTFTSSSTGESSSEVLFKTYDLGSSASTTINDSFTYADLKDGLTLGGAELPADDVAIAVGSSWKMRVEGVDASGKVLTSPGNVIISVLSPFAGLYRVIESAYYRIGAGPTLWNDTEIFIGSIDENSFSHNDWWGPFAAAGFFSFDLNEDNTITVPDTPEQLFFSGTYMLTCQEDAAMFTNVPCAGSNVLEPSGDGKHIIKLTYGYFTESSDPTAEGAREFYEVLEKIVE